MPCLVNKGMLPPHNQVYDTLAPREAARKQYQKDKDCPP